MVNKCLVNKLTSLVVGTFLFNLKECGKQSTQTLKYSVHDTIQCTEMCDADSVHR